MESLFLDAGDCKLWPVPKKTFPSCKSILGEFQTAEPAGAYFFVLVIKPFLVNLACSSIL